MSSSGLLQADDDDDDEEVSGSARAAGTVQTRYRVPATEGGVFNQDKSDTAFRSTLIPSSSGKTGFLVKKQRFYELGVNNFVCTVTNV